MSTVIAIDAGTTGVRSLAVSTQGKVTAKAYQEFTQHFPSPGWVEHDAEEIWQAVLQTLRTLIAEIGTGDISAIGITNQRETIVAWDATTSLPRHNAIVWQDRRTAHRCEQLEAEDWLPYIRSRTGLVLDPYFSATKIEWLLGKGGVSTDEDLRLGTIDSWLAWKLTGGAAHVTDVSNASRTMLMDITTGIWDDKICNELGVPSSALPRIVPSSHRVGETTDGLGIPAGIPISGMIGDQQGALFGQACFSPGMAKNTYGTGSFVLLNIGHEVPSAVDGLLTTVAWQIGDSPLVYAMEGAIFATGAAVQWLRDGLGIIAEASETGPLAASVDGTDGVYLVPAFAGLGSPYWDPFARGAILGITRGTNRAHLARAVVESMAYQTRDVVVAMEQAGGLDLKALRVDGGASAMDLLLQFQADQLNVRIERPVSTDTTALGAAFLAGLAEGVWDSEAEIAETWEMDVSVAPSEDREIPDAAYAQWHEAVARSRDWARSETPG